MNKKVTSKEEIIKNSIDLVFNNDFNIRMLADKLQISVGAIYNYFPSKADLIIEVTKTIFNEIFKLEDEAFLSTKNYIIWIFKSIKNGNKKYPDFFNNHYLLFLKDVNYAKKHMNQFFITFKRHLLTIVRNDINVKDNVFNDDFTIDNFVDFILDNIYALISQKKDDPSFLLKVLDRIIY